MDDYHLQDPTTTNSKRDTFLGHKQGQIVTRMALTNPYLSGPADTFPDTEVDQNPGYGQRYRKRYSNLTWLVQPISHLMHITSTRQQQGLDYHMCLPAVLITKSQPRNV